MKTFARLFADEHEKVEQTLRRISDRLPWPVRDVVRYSLLDGGKRLRPFLCLNILRMLGCVKPDQHELACILEMVHVSSLLHDDILDGAESRRSKPAAHTVFGAPSCLLAGDALLAEASRMIGSYANLAMVDCLAETVLHVVNGEALEIAMQGNLDNASAVYLEIIGGKTAWLFQAACRLPGLYADLDGQMLEALTQYGYNLGLAFQMVDDALDFADEAATGKPTGGDLREGKATTPILLYAQSLNPEMYEVFKHKFTCHDFSAEEVADISALIRASGFDREARKQAVAYLDRAESFLPFLPDNFEKQVLIKALAQVRDRSS